MAFLHVCPHRDHVRLREGRLHLRRGISGGAGGAVGMGVSW